MTYEALGQFLRKLWDHENGLFWWTNTIFSSGWEKYFCWVCMIRTSMLYGILAPAAFLAGDWNMSGWFSELLLLSGTIVLGLSHIIPVLTLNCHVACFDSIAVSSGWSVFGVWFPLLVLLLPLPCRYLNFWHKVFMFSVT